MAKVFLTMIHTGTKVENSTTFFQKVDREERFLQRDENCDKFCKET